MPHNLRGNDASISCTTTRKDNRNNRVLLNCHAIQSSTNFSNQICLYQLSSTLPYTHTKIVHWLGLHEYSCRPRTVTNSSLEILLGIGKCCARLQPHIFSSLVTREYFYRHSSA
ncbi:unnamed protein product, partial [Amoebophrya sp. A25]|eukprot:GSA25T00021270001.1